MVKCPICQKKVNNNHLQGHAFECLASFDNGRHAYNSGGKRCWCGAGPLWQARLWAWHVTGKPYATAESLIKHYTDSVMGVKDEC
jgi:hypothetical protein